MKILPKFPMYASGNCDFVTKSSMLEDGDKVVLLDKRAEELPYGTLCINTRTVKMIVAKLGWKLHTDDDEQALMEARRDLAAALGRIDDLENLIAARARVEVSA